MAHKYYRVVSYLLLLCIISACKGRSDTNDFPIIELDQEKAKYNTDLQYQFYNNTQKENKAWPLFDEIRYQYVGTWNILQSQNSNITIFDDKFNKKNGLMFLQFYKGKYDDIYIALTAINGDYVDGYNIFTMFNITKSPFDEKTSTYYYSGPTNFDINHDLGLLSEKKIYDVNFKIQLLNSNLNPWNIKSNKLYRLIATFTQTGDFTNQSNDLSNNHKNVKEQLITGIEGTSRIEGLEQLQAAYYIFASAIGQISTAIGLCYFQKNENYMYLGNVSVFSLSMIVVYQLTSFIYNMNLNLLQEKNSILFGYLTLGSQTIFISSVINFKLVIKALYVQQRQNPHIDSRSIKNPQVKHFLKIIGTTIICCIIAHFTIHYVLVYDYALIQAFMFPSAQIAFNARYCIRKNSFNFYYNMLMWIPPQINPIFLKGYKDNFQRLKPNYVVGIGLPMLFFVQLFIILLQKIISPRFSFLKYISGNTHNYFVPIKKIRNEIDPDYLCPICFGELAFFATPSGKTKYVKESQKQVTEKVSESGNDENLNNFFNYETVDTCQIGNKQKKCMVTPCKHYFHPKCLKQWMNLKMECPNCRAVLPPY